VPSSAPASRAATWALVLERLADDLEERQALKAKLIGAALYPAIVTVVAIVIVLFLVGLRGAAGGHVFAGTKRALPMAHGGDAGGQRRGAQAMAGGCWAIVLIAIGARLALGLRIFAEI
jgi:general secretion pathway protein F